MSTTDFGAVRTSIVAKLRAGLTTGDAVVVTGMRTEKAADVYAKGYNTVFVLDKGSSVDPPDGSANNYLKQWERRAYDVLIYVQSGKTLEADELAILTLAAKVKAVVLAFTPAGQVNNDGCLQLTGDEPIEEYMDASGVSLKVRQSYELPVQLWAPIS